MNFFQKFEEIIISFAAISVLIIFMQFAGVADQEEYQMTVFSALVNSESLRSGELSFWTNHYGFGTILPLAQRFYMHPAFLLWPNLGIPWILGIFWFSMLIGAISLVRWLRLIGVSNLISATSMFSYVFSIPVLTYLVQNDWPSSYWLWSLFPTVFYIVALIADDNKRRWIYAVSLGLIGGLWVVNGHPGHAFILIIPLIVYSFILLIFYNHIFFPILLSFVIAFLINMENFYSIYQEFTMFPDSVARFSQSQLTLFDYINSIFRPFSIYGIFSVDNFNHFFFRDVNNTRIPFVGFAFLLGCVIFIIFFKSFSIKMRLHGFGIFFALVSCFSLSLVNPSFLFYLPSGSWLFRDGVALMGIALGAVGLSYMLEKRSSLKLVFVALFVQLAQQVSVIYPPMANLMQDDVKGVFSMTGESSPFLNWLVEESSEHGTRLFFSPKVHRDVRMGLLDRGVYSASDLVLSGLEPINGYFKGTSQDAIYPSLALFHGHIGSEWAFIENSEMLDVAGIGLVLARSSELKSNGIPEGLQKLGEEPGIFDDPLVLLSNSDAWPRVSILPRLALNFSFGRLDEELCTREFLLCSDFSGFASYPEIPDVILVSPDKIQASIQPSASERVAIISQIYRPEWRAFINNRPVKVFRAVGGAFSAVILPKEGGNLELMFDTRFRENLWWIGFVTVFLSAALLCANAVLSGNLFKTKLIRTKTGG